MELWRNRSRWLMLASGVWIQCAAGASYDFGIYSEALKRSLGYNQKQLDTIGFLKDLGANVGVHSGILYPFLPPWGSLVIGSAHNFLGYFMLWLACTAKLNNVKLWEVCAFIFFGANAQVYFNTAVIVTSVKTFPGNRGLIIGLAKGFLGLSGAILTFVYQAIRGSSSDQVTFLLFIAIVPALTSLLVMFLIWPSPPGDTAREKSTLYEFSGMALALALCLVTYNIISTLCGTGEVVKIIFRVLVFVILASPVLISLKASSGSSKSRSQEEPLLSPEKTDIIVDDGLADKREEQVEEETGQDSTVLEAFSSIEFWLLFLACACGMGSGLTTIDNLSQLGSSLGYSHREVSMLVSLLSICNFLGRFGAGWLSDISLHSFGVPRPVFIVITLGIMAAGHLVIAAAFPDALYIGIVIVGMCYGSQWALMPATVSDIFGLRPFGTLFNSLAVANPLASYALSVRLAGWVYDREAGRQKTVDEDFLNGATFCNGPRCFRLTFLVLAAVCAAGSLTTLLLVSRTRNYYRKVSR